MLLEKQLGEGGKIRDKKGQVIGGVPQPTVPIVAFDENEEDMQMRREQAGARPRPGYKHSASDSYLARHATTAASNGTPPPREYRVLQGYVMVVLKRSATFNRAKLWI